MKTPSALLAMLLPAAAAAASLHHPELVLIKTDECRPESRFIASQPSGHYDPGYRYNEFGAVAVLGAEAPATIAEVGCGKATFLVDTAQSRAVDGAHVQYKVTWSIPSWAPLHPSIAGVIAEYQPTRVQPGAPEIRPWAQAGEPDLILQARVRIPTVDVVGDALVQYNLFFYVLDTVSGRVFDYIVNLYNNRFFTSWSGPLHDGMAPFVSMMLPPDGSPKLRQRYYTLSPQSAGSSITPWSQSRFYRIHVGRQQLANAIADVNAAFGTDLSHDPTNYLLIDAGVIQEHARLEDSSVVMGSSLEDFGVYTASNPPVVAENPEERAYSAR